jgi:predicted transcriptional regulator
MSTIEIREKLHQYIDTSTDDIVAAVFALFKTYNTLPADNTDEELYNREIDKAIADIAAGKFYTHEEIKSSFRK